MTTQTQASHSVLGQAEIACAVTGIQPDQARSVHDEFNRMIGSFNHKTWQNNRRRHRLNNLDFLSQEQDHLDPVTGLFKTLHLMECDFSVLRKRPKMQSPLHHRLSQLIVLALHFQERRGHNNATLISYIETIQNLTSPTLSGKQRRRLLPHTQKGSEIALPPADQHPPTGD